MHLLPALPAFLLGLVAIWFVWPLIADPIARHLSREDASAREQRPDDLFRALAERAGPDGRLMRINRG